MDISKIRRKPVTYGKSNRRLPLYDIFDVSSDSRNQHSPSISPPTVSVTQPDLDEEELISGPSQSCESSLNNKDEVKESAFDLSSSDEEFSTDGNATLRQKKRKLMPGFQPATSSANRSEDETSSHSEVYSSTTRSGKKAARNTLKSYSRTKPNARRPILQVRSKAGVSASERKGESGSSGPATPSSLASPMEGRTSATSSAHMSDSSTRSSPIAFQPTPKHKRLISTTIGVGNRLDQSHNPHHLDDAVPLRRQAVSRQHGAHMISDQEEVVSGPSQLGLKSLRLTPEKQETTSEERPADAAANPTQLTPRRGRQRLVDRLDAPRTQTVPSQSPAKDRVNSEIVSLRTNELRIQNGNESLRTRTSPQRKVPKLVQESSFEIQTVRDPLLEPLVSKPKKTYGQERFNTSDVTLEKSQETQPISSEATRDQIVHQINSQTSISSQLELDESDSDDPAGGSRMKSIHELRRAGANNRFNQEAETIFEDIELPGSSSKSLRLHAMTQVLEKLQKSEFSSSFLDGGFDVRLASAALENLDPLNSALIAQAFLMSLEIDTTRPQIPDKVVEAILHSSTLILDEKRPISKLAKDRKQNLSKSVIREILECETSMVSLPIWGDFLPSQLVPQSLAIQLLSSTAKLLRGLGVPLTNISSELLMKTLRLLHDYCEQLSLLPQDAETKSMVRTIASFLENCDLSQPASLLALGDDSSPSGLGHLLATILGAVRGPEASLEQAVLRIVVNLSNNKSKVCARLASTPIVKGVFAIVEVNFMPLAESTDNGDVFDKAKLDSVILALGCLLNFADCSSEARLLMLDLGDPPRSCADWLLNTFNVRVEKALGVTTVDQSQVLVAFGYLSILLCTLCLDDDFRHYAKLKLHGQSLDELFVAGKTFFFQLQQVQGINPEDEAMKAFTNRFGHILISMRELDR